MEQSTGRNYGYLMSFQKIDFSEMLLTELT